MNARRSIAEEQGVFLILTKHGFSNAVEIKEFEKNWLISASYMKAFILETQFHIRSSTSLRILLQLD
jgi:hypothetical protein